MFKLINFLVKRPDLSLEQMKEHYERSHVPMALRTFPDILEHRRNYLPKDSAMAPPACPCPRWIASPNCGSRIAPASSG